MHLPYLLTVILIVDYTVGTSIPRRNCHGNCHDERQVPSKLFSPVLKNINFVICPGSQGMCPSETTCCKLKIGVWGCCPLPKAVCCSDGEHCCPHGYTCDIAKATCNNGSTILKIFSKEPATQINAVVCPGGEMECPDKSTCCKLKSGEWGCCPPPKAVCCSDGEHCCPHGYTCDVATATCSSGSTTLAIFSKKPATKRSPSVVCPGGQVQCPGETTCCKLKSGEYGCCPFPKAVCCSDGKHCCPNGYTCDVAAGMCNKGLQILNIFSKKPATKRSPSVICPGGQVQCPCETTCCKLKSGEYGCCPLPKAVCCSDDEHCCPNGYTCDVAAGKCNKGSQVLNIFSKKPASQIKIVTCPGGQQECPDGFTCCKLPSGIYGCCPLPNAVCCSDGEHCCPQGFTCDVAQRKCVGDRNILNIFSKIPATQIKSVICPGGQDECLEGNTCCKLESGEYGCCPLPNAVCCSDGEHCCPQGYTCDVSAGTCLMGLKTVKYFPKQPAVKVANEHFCADDKHVCPEDQTCCKIPGELKYGCCPYSKGTCCRNSRNCCPHGYECNSQGNACMKMRNLSKMFSQEPAVTVKKTENARKKQLEF